MTFGGLDEHSAIIYVLTAMDEPPACGEFFEEVHDNCDSELNVVSWAGHRSLLSVPVYGCM
jgi:hypothetical protein